MADMWMRIFCFSKGIARGCESRSSPTAPRLSRGSKRLKSSYDLRLGKASKFSKVYCCSLDPLDPHYSYTPRPEMPGPGAGPYRSPRGEYVSGGRPKSINTRPVHPSIACDGKYAEAFDICQ